MNVTKEMWNETNRLSNFTTALSMLCNEESTVRVELKNGMKERIKILHDGTGEQIGFTSLNENHEWNLSGMHRVSTYYNISKCNDLYKVIGMDVENMGIEDVYNDIQSGVISLQQFYKWVDHIKEQ